MSLLQELFKKYGEIEFVEYNDLESGLIVLVPSHERREQADFNGIPLIEQDKIKLSKNND